MTGFRQCFSPVCCLLLCSFWFCSPLYAVEQQTAETPLVALQQENAALQRKVHRLERQADALRQELNAPDATQVIGGIGYIVGLFGVASWFVARKKTTQEH